MKHKILMTLVALFAMTTGAWADETPIVTITATGSGPAYSVEGIVTLETGGASYGAAYGWYSGSPINLTVTAADGVTITKVKFIGNKDSSWEDTESPFQVLLSNYCVKNASQTNIGPDDGVKSIEVYGTIAPAEPAIDFKWDAAKKTGSFEMPAYDVEIAPIYAPTAVFATEGDKVLAPTAVEGIIAGTEDAIVKAGTVAKTGDNVQGTAMYFATTDAEMTAEKAAAADGWLSTLPTAAGYDDAQTVYVWYYIKGADTPQGETATAENTFNDSEICATPLTVTVLSNKFDIQFNAANDNTIEAGKATVKVGDAAATVTDGKIEKVKMGSKVTFTAKDGYKFRKAEAKKGIAKLLTIGEVTLDITGCTTWQDVIFKNYTKIESSVGYVWTRGGSFILKNSSGNVSTDAVVDPNATDYYWSSSN